MFENQYMWYRIMYQRQKDLLAEAARSRLARTASEGGRAGFGARLLSSLGEGMVRLGLRLQGSRRGYPRPDQPQPRLRAEDEGCC
jgi:hypothetical protein